MADNTFLWKPISESDGNLVVLLPSELNNNIQQVYLVDSSGNVLEKGKFTGFKNGDRGHYRFSKSGGNYPSGTRTIAILNDGTALSYNTGQTSSRNEGLSANRIDNPVDISPAFSNIQATGEVTNNITNGAYSTTVSSPSGNVSYQVPQANFGSFDIPELPYIQLPTLDQTGIAGEIGDFNIQQQQRAFDIGTQQGQDLLDLEIQGLRDYITEARQLRQEGAIDENEFNRRQISASNQFNQLERLKAVDIALPEARNFISEGIERNKQLAAGIIPDTLQDRAYELASRSLSADAISAGGFGAGSIAGQKTSDLMSAQQRLNLSQTGESQGMNFLRLGMELNFDQPIKQNPILSNTSENITGLPSQPLPALVQTQAAQLTGLSTISPQQAIAQEYQQNIAQAELDRQADIANIQASTDEQLMQLNASLFNQQQLAAMQNLASDTETVMAQTEAGQKAAQTSALIGAGSNILGQLASTYGSDVVSAIKNYITGGTTDTTGVTTPNVDLGYSEGLDFSSVYQDSSGNFLTDTSQEYTLDSGLNFSNYYAAPSISDYEAGYFNDSMQVRSLNTANQLTTQMNGETRYILPNGYTARAVKAPNGNLAITNTVPSNAIRSILLNDGTPGYLLDDGSIIKAAGEAYDANGNSITQQFREFNSVLKKKLNPNLAQAT